MERRDGHWGDSEEAKLGWRTPVQFVCPYCGREVASERGWSCHYRDEAVAEVRICPNCNRAIFFEDEKQYPGAPIGNPIKHLPPSIETLYNEARASASANAPTATVLALRKLLMNIAVNKGAPTGQTFQQYVDYLASKGYVSPDGKMWVDHIRKKGNDANHEIALMDASDAEELMAFAEMLLKTIYEFPNRILKVPMK